MRHAKRVRLALALVGVLAGCAGVDSGEARSRGIGPGNLVVTSPVRAYESAPYAAHEQSDTWRSRRGGGPLSASPVEGEMAPGLYLARTRTRVEDLERRVTDAVDHENVAVDALAIVRARGRAVLAAARAATADGVVTRRERDQVDTLMRDAERESAAAVPVHRAWSGGRTYWR